LNLAGIIITYVQDYHSAVANLPEGKKIVDVLRAVIESWLVVMQREVDCLSQCPEFVHEILMIYKNVFDGNGDLIQDVLRAVNFAQPVNFLAIADDFAVADEDKILFLADEAFERQSMAAVCMFALFPGESVKNVVGSKTKEFNILIAAAIQDLEHIEEIIKKIPVATKFNVEEVNSIRKQQKKVFWEIVFAYQTICNLNIAGIDGDELNALKDKIDAVRSVMRGKVVFRTLNTFVPETNRKIQKVRKRRVDPFKKKNRGFKCEKVYEKFANFLPKNVDTPGSGAPVVCEDRYGKIANFLAYLEAYDLLRHVVNPGEAANNLFFGKKEEKIASEIGKNYLSRSDYLKIIALYSDGKKVDDVVARIIIARFEFEISSFYRASRSIDTLNEQFSGKQFDKDFKDCSYFIKILYVMGLLSDHPFNEKGDLCFIEPSSSLGRSFLSLLSIDAIEMREAVSRVLAFIACNAQ